MKTLDELAPPMLPVYGGICQGRGWTVLGLSLQGGGGVCEPLGLCIEGEFLLLLFWMIHKGRFTCVAIR